jgi:putative ABC transport system permease protein
MEATVSADEIREELSARRAFNQLFQGYMGLGLLVGVAALGVVSFRSVVERRQAIGVLRAIGFRSSMIRTQFLIESTFISLLGIVLGVILGSLTSWNIIKEMNEQFGGLEFTIPWSTIAVIVGITYVFSLLTTYWPARQAAQIYPAEALRYE